MYNKTFFSGKNLYDTKLKLYSLNHFFLKDGIIIAIFQGSRGVRPDLDYIIKYLEPGVSSRLRTPTHTHLIVDLLIKYEINPDLTYKFIRYFWTKYEEIQPFENAEQRTTYQLFTPPEIEKLFPKIEHTRSYSLEYLSAVLELSIKCEKRYEEAFMFRRMLTLMIAYCEGKKDYFQVVGLSKRV